MKDKLLLAFWGLVAGAVFVGCILGFGSVVNWINAQGSALPVSAQVFKVGLLFVIVLVLVGMGKVFLVFNRKKAREEAEKIFDAELLDARDEAGQTPLDYAARFGKDDTLRRLQSLLNK